MPSNYLLPLESPFTSLKTEAVPLARRHQVVEAMAQYLAKAEALYRRTFKVPTVSFDQRGKAAGMAYLQKNHIRYNPVLLNENYEEFIATTVPHEIAHLIAYQRFGRGVQAHGTEWKRIMVDFGVPPARCHSFDVSNASVGESITYRCACASHALSLRRHKKVLSGIRYVCKKCKQPLTCQGAVEPLIPGVDPSLKDVERRAPSPEAPRPPTAKMVSYLGALAKKHKKHVPISVYKDFQECARWISELKNLSLGPTELDSQPTEKQLLYAQTIATRRGLTIPPQCLHNRRALSAWIDQHKS